MMDIIKAMLGTIVLFAGMISMLVLSYVMVPFVVVGLIFTSLYLIIKLSQED